MTRIQDLVLEPAARGPHAAVYRSRIGDQIVAVKIYNTGAARPRRVERAAREAQALRRIDHPAVARLLQAGELVDGSPYLISAWIDGESLAERLARGAVPWRGALSIVASLAEALIVVHSAGIVHRDLKPSNILLPAIGKPAAVLVDFGHCLLAGDGRLTESGVVLGSASYMAPEQGAGLAVDLRADLYALGIVLYELLTGCLPFQASSAAELVRLHQTEPVVGPRRRAPANEISPSAEDLCLWLLAKTPQGRPPSARVLGVTVAALLQESIVHIPAGASS